MPGQTWCPRATPRWPATGFNGGPGNCPAKLVEQRVPDGLRRVASMEGRAIARPNHSDGTPMILDAGLQWRAGQLPGQTILQVSGISTRGRFNGGPGNCPAKLFESQ